MIKMLKLFFTYGEKIILLREQCIDMSVSYSTKIKNATEARILTSGTKYSPKAIPLKVKEATPFRYFLCTSPYSKPACTKSKNRVKAGCNTRTYSSIHGFVICTIKFTFKQDYVAGLYTVFCFGCTYDLLFVQTKTILPMMLQYQGQEYHKGKHSCFR